MNRQSSVRAIKVDCETIEVCFDGFEGLPAVKGQDSVESPEFTYFGHQWFLRVYPGGDSTSASGKVSVYLCHRSPGSSCVQFSFIAKQSRAKAAAYYHVPGYNFPPYGERNSGWGTRNFADRTTILESLEDGALVIEVQMKQTGTTAVTAPFVPENPCSKNTLSKFLDEESADMVFEVSTDHVGGERRTRKRAKTSPTTFHAHRFVLPKSGALAEACETSHDLTPIPITGTKPEIFRHLLYYLYGGAMDDDEMKENAKDIIDAADRFGIVGLKLAAEAAYVSSTTITIDNAIDNLLYADAKNCPLLKEVVIDFIAGNEAAQKLSFQDVPGAVIPDFLAAMNRGKKKESGESGRDLSTMRVCELRKKLYEKGLEVDGSRETLISALEENPDE